MSNTTVLGYENMRQPGRNDKLKSTDSNIKVSLHHLMPHQVTRMAREHAGSSPAVLSLHIQETTARCPIPLSAPPSYHPPSFRTRKQHPAFVPDRYYDDCSQYVRFVLQRPCRQLEMICRREQCFPLPWTGVPNLKCTFKHTKSLCIIYLCHVPDLMLRLSDCIKCRGTILCWITDGFSKP